MARVQGFQLKVPQILTRLFEMCRGWFEKMETAYDVNNPVFTAYRLSPLHNIADTGMRAASDDNQSLTRAKCQRRVVKNMIFDRSIRKDYFSHSGIDPFELESHSNLPQKDKVFGKMSRGCGGTNVKEPGQLLL
jgi:hypothetical protein